jgi:hypothetical protein
VIAIEGRRETPLHCTSKIGRSGDGSLVRPDFRIGDAISTWASGCALFPASTWLWQPEHVPLISGFGTTLVDVVNFYNGRFGIGLSAQEEVDLVNFLRSL